MARTQDAAHEADRMPSEDEEQAADRSTQQLRDSGDEEAVAEHFEEMAKRGVEQKGEGRIE